MIIRVSAQPSADVQCAYCHGALGTIHTECPGCATRLHVDCRWGLRGCPTLGCDAPARLAFGQGVRAPEPAASWPPPRTRAVVATWLNRTAFAACLLFGVGAVTVQIALAECADLSRARADLTQLNEAIHLYRLDTGTYPEALRDLRSRPLEVRRWAGPYVSAPIPQDPWGSDYVYVSGGGLYELISYGRDGAPGGAGFDRDVRLIDFHRRRGRVPPPDHGSRCPRCVDAR